MEIQHLNNQRPVKKSAVNLESKKVSVVLSEETEVVRYSWDKGKYFITLLHGSENVDLSRKDILSVFVNHDTYDLPIGKFENVRLEDGKLKADALFDEDDEQSMKIFNKLAKGFLQSFSVGIDVHSMELAKEVDDIKYYNATSWAINEASVVGIPAIPTAKVGLNHESGVNPASAKIETKTKGENSMEYTKESFKALEHDHAEALKANTKEVEAAERKRVSDIFALGGNVEFTQKAISDGSTVGDTAIALLKEQKETNTAAATDFEAAGAAANEAGNVESSQEELSAEDKAWKDAENLHYKKGEK